MHMRDGVLSYLPYGASKVWRFSVEVLGMFTAAKRLELEREGRLG